MTNQMSLRSYNTETSSHSHDFAQLVLPITGSLELEIASRSGIVSEDTGALIAPGEQHCFAGSLQNLFLVLDIPTPNIILNKALPSPFINLTPTSKKFLQFTHHYLRQANHDPSSQYLIYQLLLNFFSPLTSSDNDHRASLAKHWIDSHVVAPINIRQLAQYCHLSISQLQRRFKQMTGQSMGEYWRVKKLQHAQMLLCKNHLSIEEIAYEVGYENLSAFSRRFTQSFGMSPSQWRNMTLAAKSLHLNDKRCKQGA